MKTIRLVMSALLFLGALVMLGFAAFCIYQMVNYPSYYRYGDSFFSMRRDLHFTVSVATWIVHVLAGIVFLASAILLPSWWRKGLAGWGMFTCLIMLIAPFILSGKISFDEIGFLWIIAAVWLAFLSAALGVSALFGPKAVPALANPTAANTTETSPIPSTT